MKLPTEVSEVCRTWFGAYRGRGSWSTPNRCDSCPLRSPCLTWGMAPAHTPEQMDAARGMFVDAAVAIIAAGEAP